MTGLKWDPAQGEAPKPDTVTEAMEHSQRRAIMTTLQKTQKAAESDADIFSQAMDKSS